MLRDRRIGILALHVILIACSSEPEAQSGQESIKIKKTIVDTVQTELGTLFKVEKRDEKGILLAKYNLNQEKQYHGEYLEYYVDGTLKLKAKFLSGKKVGTHSLYYPNGELEQSHHYTVLKLSENGMKRAVVKTQQIIFDTSGQIIDSLSRYYIGKYNLKEEVESKYDSIYLRFKIPDSETAFTKYWLCFGDIEFGFYNYESKVDTCIRIDPNKLFKYPLEDLPGHLFNAVLIGERDKQGKVDTIKTYLSIIPKTTPSNLFSNDDLMKD